MDLVSIRILEKENNKRGDLFGRLMADLFVALGYEQPQLNVHLPGRELDLTADHRLEKRRAVAECKATASPAGGDAVNKFGASGNGVDEEWKVTYGKAEKASHARHRLSRFPTGSAAPRPSR